MLGVKDLEEIINKKNEKILEIGEGEEREVVKKGEIKVENVMYVKI